MSTLATRTTAIASARARGQRIVAALPYHYPRALLRAHGCHPVEVWGPPWVATDSGASHFQAYACGIVLKGASFLIDGGFDQVDAVLVPHACDALQGLGSVLIDYVAPRPPVLTFYLPRGRRPADVEFCAAELRRLGRRLVEVTGVEPDAAAWSDALDAEESADAALAGLYRRRAHLALGDRAFYDLVRAREYLSAEEFVAAVGAAPEGEAPGDGVGVLLSGIVPEPMTLFDELEQMGARVVADDLGCGWRRVYPPSSLADPYERLAERLVGGPPEPTRGSPISTRVDALVERLGVSGARGMIVYDVKFCEPELFDIPLLRQGLAAAGFPMLHVEVEMGPTISQQTLTRLEAFVETIR